LNPSGSRPLLLAAEDDSDDRIDDMMKKWIDERWRKVDPRRSSCVSVDCDGTHKATFERGNCFHDRLAESAWEMILSRMPEKMWTNAAG
jgi:hypothetical protein